MNWLYINTLQHAISPSHHLIKTNGKQLKCCGLHLNKRQHCEESNNTLNFHNNFYPITMNSSYLFYQALPVRNVVSAAMVIADPMWTSE